MTAKDKVWQFCCVSANDLRGNVVTFDSIQMIDTNYIILLIWIKFAYLAPNGVYAIELYIENHTPNQGAGLCVPSGHVTQVVVPL